MSDRFDPHYTWLGIPPHEQPANHYRLLGISLFESNDEVISNAADRLMLHLRAFQSGKRSKESQQLLNEISAARVCLLNPEAKSAYDTALRAKQSDPEATTALIAVPPLPTAAAPLPSFAPARGKSRSGKKSKPSSGLGVWIATAGLALLVLGGGLGLWLAGNRTRATTELPQSNNTSPAGTPHPVPTNTTSSISTNPAEPKPPSQPLSTSSTAQEFTVPEIDTPTWHDLLKLVDVNQDRVWGPWQLSDGVLKTNAQSSDLPGALPIAGLALPVAPLGEYRLRIKLSFPSGECHAAIVLPVAERLITFSVGARFQDQSRSGFERIDGQRLDTNPTWTSIIQPRDGQPHQLELIVLPQDQVVSLYALWDGQPASHWAGDRIRLSSLGEFTTPGQPALSLAAMNSSVVFHAVELGILSGDVRYRRDIVPRLAANISAPEATSPTSPVLSIPSSASNSPPPDNQTPALAPTPRVTNAEALAQAEKDVQVQYAVQLAAAKRADQKLALVDQLRGAAGQSQADIPRKAALLLEAERLAASAGDIRQAVSLARERVAPLSLDLLNEIAELLKTTSFAAAQRTENFALADWAMQFADQAVAEDRFDAAEPLTKAAGQAYTKLRHLDAIARTKDRLADVTAMKAEYDKVQEAFTALAANPKDADANLAIGRYQCFYKNEWDAGLPKLAAGSDADLAAAARKDLEKPRAAAAAALADQLWDVGQKLSASAKRNVLRRAAECYLIAMPSLQGNSRTAAVRRIDQATPTRGDATAVVKEGLLSYWGFDEGSGRLAQDTTRTKNHALLQGAGWARGPWGYALHMGAFNECAQVLTPVSLRQWTLSLWMRIDQLQGDGGLFMALGNNPGNVHLYLRSDGMMQANIFNSGNSNPRLHLEPARWHHVAWRYFANDQRAAAEVFVNGELDSKFNANKDIAPILGPARIGGWSDEVPGRAFLGAIDDLRLYGRALSDVELIAIYSAGQTEL